MRETGEGADGAAWLSRAKLWEPAIDAWSYLPDETPAAMNHTGLLAGAPFAVKDVIDVAGMATRCGWDGLASAEKEPRDAAVVAALRAAGAIPVGKTRSTAFAFVDPTTTRNPYDPERTPGGSSSGSGSVVGAGVVPFALGTQTAGSLCRPAAFCGAYAFKPSIGAWPTAGMRPLSRSFDAVGVIAAGQEWLARVVPVLFDAFGVKASEPEPASLRIGRVVAPEQAPEPQMVLAMDRLEAGLRDAGHRVTLAAPTVSFDDLIADHRLIMLSEAAEDVLPLTGGREAELPPRLRAGLREGKGISVSQREAALTRVLERRAAFWRSMADFDLMLAYPAPGAAPRGLATTGDQSYQTPWTALGGPLAAIPCGLDVEGAPLGALLAAPPGEDAALLRAVGRLSPCFPPTPSPPAPASRRA